MTPEYWTCPTCHRQNRLVPGRCEHCEAVFAAECEARARLEEDANCQANRLTLAADEIERRGKVIAEKDKVLKKVEEKQRCDVCAGTKQLLTGESCVCKDGTVFGLVNALREAQVKAEKERDEMQKMYEACEEFANVDTNDLMKERDDLREKVKLLREELARKREEAAWRRKAYDSYHAGELDAGAAVSSLIYVKGEVTDADVEALNATGGQEEDK